jgi:hypothetical protein
LQTRRRLQPSARFVYLSSTCQLCDRDPGPLTRTGVALSYPPGDDPPEPPGCGLRPRYERRWKPLSGSSLVASQYRGRPGDGVAGPHADADCPRAASQCLLRLGDGVAGRIPPRGFSSAWQGSHRASGRVSRAVRRRAARRPCPHAAFITEILFSAEYFHAIRIVILHDKINLRATAACAPDMRDGPVISRSGPFRPATCAAMSTLRVAASVVPSMRPEQCNRPE